MLAAIRTFAKSWPARILLAVLAVSFVGWGVNHSGIAVVTGNDVVKAGAHSVDAAAFRREYDNAKKRIEQESGQALAPESPELGQLVASVLNGAATRAAFGELMAKSGVRPSDDLILAQIQKIPAFFDPVSGRFDRKTFDQRLSENGYTPETFDAVIRDDLAIQQWGVGMQNGLTAPRAYGALASVFALESRDVSFFLLTPQSVPAPAPPTDAQLAAFITENKAQLTLPEMRVITVAAFTPQAVAASLGAIDPAELKKRYDFRKDTLSKPEVRTVIQIPVKDAATARVVAGRLGAGEAPAAIAKSLGVDAITYADKPLTAIADRKVGQAAFGMAAGQVSAVQGELGVAVVKVVSVTPGRVVTLEEARPALEAELRKDMAAEKVYALTQTYDDTHQGGASLPDAAKKAGVPVSTLGPITAQGVNPQGQQLQGFPPKILEAAFKLPAGGESEVTDLGDGAYFAVRVEKVLPAHVPPLAEIRPLVTRAWMQQQVVKALEGRAEALSARIRKGEAMDAVAASSGYSVQRIADLTRQTAGTHQALGRELLARAFAGKPGEVWTSRTPNALAVGRVDKVRMDVGPTAARLAESSRNGLSEVIGREMADSAQLYARTRMKVRADMNRARAAAGLPPLKKDAAEKKK